ncbi:MAG: hypothetical protein ICV73_19665 [Acetobacteraceae bacterium]|nr:hypothetical protein [Acetobacteraceae bacterium]
MDEKALTDAVAALAARLPLAEPPEAALAAEECRLAWLPGRVRVLLLAESHIATSAADLAWRVALPPGLDWPGPARFVRHIYCAGYGEPELLEAPPGAAAEARPRGGTPQFWRLMAAAEGADCPAWPAVARGGTEAAARLPAKAALLHRLRARGIWLTDASLAALAVPSVRRHGDATLDALALRESWRLYHGALLPALEPAHVAVIGLGVARTLAAELDRAFPGRWTALRQPNGARSFQRTRELWETLASICDCFAPARSATQGG